MEILEDKYLTVRTRNPHRILTAIQNSQIIQQEDDIFTVLADWSLPAAQTLRRLRIKGVPSPIRRDYDWPGLYEPMAHQVTTAEFLTLHSRAYCFNEQGCVDSETEYLSPTGWVRIADYVGGQVAQFHPETGMAEFVDPLKFVKLPCAEMVEFKSKYGIDQLLSPEHRVLHYKSDRNNGDSELFWRVDSAQALHDKLHDRSISDVLFKTTYGVIGGAGIPLSDAELRVQIAVIADGYFGSATKHCVVRIKKERKVLRLRDLLTAAGIAFEETTPEYAGAEGFHIFRFQAPWRTKVFGAEFWAATPAQLKLITEEVPHWDGTFRKSNGVSFYSTQKESVDFVQHAFVTQGKVARIVSDNRGCWQVYVRDNARLVSISNRHKEPHARMVPSTDGFKYCFMVPSTFLVFRRNGCVFVSGNTGKTASAIWASDYLLKQGAINRVLVVCPLSIMQAAWQRDLFTFATHRKVGIAHGSRERRRIVLEGDYQYVIINYDGVEIVEKEIIAAGFDLVIVDEMNAYKTTTTKRWKSMKRIVGDDASKKMLWGMTGTPAAQSPADAFGLAKLCTPANVPRFFGTFKDSVMVNVARFKWMPKPNAHAVVHAALQPAIRFEKKDCLDLPEVTYTDRDAPLTPQQVKYYEMLRKEFLITAGDEEITAANAAVNLNKMLQISGGAVYSNSGAVIEFDVSNRLNVVEEAINEASHKVLVFVPFTHTIELVRAHLTKHHIPCEVINGAVSAGKRNEIFARFQTKDETDLKVLIIQPAAASHGVTLTAADTIIWYAPVTSTETYLQANARIDRHGQKNAMTVIHVTGSPIERRLYKMLREKLMNHQKLIDLYNEELTQ